MTPVESVIPLNPSLNHLDELDARLKLSTSSVNSSGTTSRRSNQNSLEDLSTSSSNTGANANANSSANASASASAAKAIQVQFRKKETEEQVQARLNSFAHLQRQIDDEPWINLKYYSSKVKKITLLIAIYLLS